MLRGDSIRLIDAENKQLGIVTPQQALTMAKDAELDLVLVADQVQPPVCRLMNFNKFKYEQQRRERELRKKQHLHRNKEVQFHANIDTHDYQIKMGHMLEFLEKGHKVKISLRFRGREMAHKELGMEVMERVIRDLGARVIVEGRPRIMGRSIIMLLAPAHA